MVVVGLLSRQKAVSISLTRVSPCLDVGALLNLNISRLRSFKDSKETK